jgi:hypothetical protein
MGDGESREASSNDWERACCQIIKFRSTSRDGGLTYRTEDENEKQGEDVQRSVIGASSTS